MPNSVKYNTESEANALTIGNMHIGAGDIPKGPTSSTGFYNGINPPNGGYTIYIHKATEGSSILLPTNDAELIVMTNQIAGASYTTINECFSYFAGQSGKFVLHNPINFMVTDGLILNLNANILPSYPRSGTSWKDLSGESNNGVLTNSPTFNSNGWIEFDGTDDEVIIPDDSTLDLTTDMSFEFVVKVDSTQNNLYPRLIDKSIWLIHLSQTSPFSIAQNITTSAGLRQTALGSSFAANKWAHIVSNYDGQYGKIYVNGELVKTSNFGSVLACNTNSTVVTVGGNTGTTRQLNGDMALVRVYDEVLTQTEVNQNYHQAPIVTDGLVFAADAGNLVSYENGSATSYSLTGSNNGALTNGVGFDSSNGGTWTFDGVDDRIVTQTNSVLGTFSDWSMDAWIKYENSGYSGWMIVVDQATYSQYQKNIMVWLSSDATNKKIAMYDGSWQYSASTIPVSTWTHISATTEGNTAKMYINGELDVTRTFNWSNTSNVTNYMGIGSHGSNPSYKMNGNIAVVKIYDKVLTADEVAQNYNANINRFN